MPLTILLLFNIIVSFYTKAQAEQDLQQAVSDIKTNLENEGYTNLRVANFRQGETDINTPKINDSDINELTEQQLPNMGALINNQNHSTSAELVVFNRNGELSKIFNNESFVTEQLAEIIYQQTENLEFNEIGTFNYESDTYYVVEVEYQSTTLSDKVVYVSKGLVLDEFVNIINIVLLIVSAIITLVAVYVSSKVTNSIAKPIERLTSLVENIKSDEILMIDDRSDSVEIHKLTTEINALNKRIYHYNQSQKNFLHNASHELRTPLMSIQGYADGIEMGIFEDAKGTAHLISNQSKRLTKLVDSLLALARAENFNATKKLESINISNGLLDLLNEYNGYALSQNIVLNTRVVPNIFAKTNNELLNGSVGNIISNAIRYAKSNVYVSLNIVDSNAVIKIQDDGNGIQHLDKIFERFSKGEDGNFGLGLSIAKTSVDMMNGKIKAYNDGGAVFEIELPLYTVNP